jgi:hypothetical protein
MTFTKKSLIYTVVYLLASLRYRRKEKEYKKMLGKCFVPGMMRKKEKKWKQKRESCFYLINYALAI